jgi:hypothetical protein
MGARNKPCRWRTDKSSPIGLPLHFWATVCRLGLMDFEILSDITDIETIVVGKAIRELQRLRRQYRRGAGASGRESQPSGCQAGGSGEPSCTGMRRMRSGAGS